MCLAVPGKIIRLKKSDPLIRLGEVSFDGALRDVNLTFTPEAGVGDYVLVHAGFALNTVDEKQARQTLEDLAEMLNNADEGHVEK